MRHLRLRPAAVQGDASRTWEWWRVGVLSDLDRWCFGCGKEIPKGKQHARDDKGHRLCMWCVGGSQVSDERAPSLVNRRQRHAKLDRVAENAVRFLLDGLEVGSISELKQLVETARETQRIMAPVLADLRAADHERTCPMLEGWYYLHANGDLIYKGAAYTDISDLRDSDLVRAFWPQDPEDRECAWNTLVESLAAGARPDRVRELAEKWGCDDEDAQEYASRVNVILRMDGDQWCAIREDFVDLGESPAGFGFTCLDAMAQLAKAARLRALEDVGRRFRPARVWTDPGVVVNCPTCDSPAPERHPAMQFEGEVQPCRDAFHLTVTPENTPERIAETQAFFAKQDLPGHIENVRAALIAAKTTFPNASWGDLEQSLAFVRDADYRDGFVGGVSAYAYSSSEPWAEPGVQYVGTGGRTRIKAISEVEQTHNYRPPSVR